MCGIAGIVVGQGQASLGAVAAMTGLMAHRGPDGEGLWRSPDGRVALGHRRLSIIDVSQAAAQPMADAEGRVVLTFNGEIYNYRELAVRLEAEGARFVSRSDSEVLLAAYKHWGEDCLSEFNGMFAFVLWDQTRRVLFCARDRFGEKPFLFTRRPGFFAFASEYKALLALDGVSAEIDRARLGRFLVTSSLGLDTGRVTVFPAISQLLPGECMTLDLDTLDPRIRRYWAITPQPAATMDATGTFAAFHDLLRDSVSLRLRSDVPVGSCLSGGLDSSAIVCLARQIQGHDRPYHVFVGRFPGTPADEWTYAEQVIKATGATAHVVEPDPARLVEELPAFAWANELPVGSTSQYAQYCVFRLAREAGITVLLDGQGADELLGGYEQYFAPYLAACRAQGLAVEEESVRARYPLALDSGATGLKRRLPPGLKRLLAGLTGKGSDVALGLAEGVLADIEAENPPPGFDPLRAALFRDSFQTHLPTLLRYGDRNSMAHSREVRLPFCDHRLAEMAFKVPLPLLMGGAQTKRLLRESMRGILPEGVRTRWNKQGFLPPQDLWFAGGLGRRVREIIESPDFARRGLWNVRWWRSVLRRFEAGETALAWTLWRPLMAETWLTHFVDRAAGQPKHAAMENAP